MRVLVLAGGDSNERTVSLRSARLILDALSHTDHVVTMFDPVNGIDKLKVLAAANDVVLPILHGKNGEDGYIQGVLEEAKISYLGADKRASENASDKVTTHSMLKAANIIMPKFAVVDKDSFSDTELFNKPFVLKPILGGSSIDILIARKNNKKTAAQALVLIGKYGSMLLEELVEGLEITVSVLGDESLPTIAIIPPEDGEFDYENKYNGKTTEICPVPSSVLSIKLQDKARKLALDVHRALGIRHLSRTDMIVKSDGEIVVLELNTIPGLTEQSLFPKSAKAAGISMVEMVDRFVELAKNGQ